METDEIAEESKTHREKHLGVPISNASWRKISITGYRISSNTAIHDFVFVKSNSDGINSKIK